jgi:hypothetical protein
MATFRLVVTSSSEAIIGVDNCERKWQKTFELKQKKMLLSQEEQGGGRRLPSYL